MQIDQHPTSRPIEIVPYRPEWHAEFLHIGRRLRLAVGDAALRIDHIGSTAVPNLAAKDVIDIQITVPKIPDENLLEMLRAHGFRLHPDIRRDNFIGLPDETSPELAKHLAREPEGERRAHIHIRQQGRFNQRYPLLFRDFLRANPTARGAYELIKVRLAETFPNSIDGYLYIKDPLMDIIYEAASLWAESVGWQPDAEHL